MSEAESRESLVGLERALTEFGPMAHVYVRPIGLLSGRCAAEMVAEGTARPVAGGPIAMTACAIQIRAGRRRAHRAVVGMPELWDWARQAGTTSHILTLLERIEAPRAGIAGGPHIMGVVNVTPDSFSDGGEHLDPAAALAHCGALAAEGADILDIGGESTRPGAAPVPPEEELSRVRPVLEGLRKARAELAGVAVSIDTRHAAVMRAALATGADMINDVTALTGDPASLAVATGSAARIVLVHMQGTPETMNVAPLYDDVALDVFDYLEARIEACLAAGIEPRRLIIDPGIGFGKGGRENLELLRALPLFHGLGCPILLGLSRKGLGVSRGSVTPAQRLPLSLAAAMHALSSGVQMLRVHDVAATRQVVALWRRLDEFEPWRTRWVVGRPSCMDPAPPERLSRRPLRRRRARSRHREDPR